MIGRTRIERVLVQWGVAVVAVLLLCGVAALGGAGLLYTDASVEEVSTETNQQQFGVTAGTSATVTGNTTLYDADERLQDMPVYFLDVSPNLTVSVRTAVPADRSVDVSQRITLSMRASRDGQEFWQSRRVLNTARMTVSDGEMRLNATMNMSDVRANLDEKRNAIGPVGTIDTRIVVNTTYESDAYSGSLTAESPVVFSEGGYWLDGELSDSASHSTTETRQVEQRPNMALVGGLSVLGIALLAAAAFLGVWSRSLDGQAVETTVARSRFEEWISNGEIPTKSEKEYIRTDSLEDLVDVAIDSGKRVIYDDELDAYAVVEGDLVYYFTTGGEDITDWFDV